MQFNAIVLREVFRESVKSAGIGGRVKVIHFSRQTLTPCVCVFVCFQAIQQPSNESVQEKAWTAVVPLVGKLKKFYEFSLKLGMRLHCVFTLHILTLNPVQKKGPEPVIKLGLCCVGLIFPTHLPNCMHFESVRVITQLKNIPREHPVVIVTLY